MKIGCEELFVTKKDRIRNEYIRRSVEVSYVKFVMVMNVEGRNGEKNQRRDV